MDNVILIAIIVLGLAFIAFMPAWIYYSSGCDAARAEGYRKGLKVAIEIARTRSDTALQLAPSGQLTYGLIRAQVADNIQLDISDVLARAPGLM